MSPPAWDFVFRSFWRYISPKTLHRVISIPTQQYKRLKAFTSETMKTSKELVDRKVEEIRLEKKQKDMMGILGGVASLKPLSMSLTTFRSSIKPE
jgi:hypothetical protein